MKKTLLIVTLLIIIGFNFLNSQMVKEWKTVATGHFNDTYFDKESAVCEGKYLVALSRAKVYPSYNMFDSNYVLLSQDSGKTWNGILKWGYEKFDSSMKNWKNFRYNYVDMPTKDLILILRTYEIYGTGGFACKTTDLGETWIDYPTFYPKDIKSNDFGDVYYTANSWENQERKLKLFKFLREPNPKPHTLSDTTVYTLIVNVEENERFLAQDIQIYPNPASEYIEITVDAHCNVPVQEIKIYNTYGQCVINYQFQITNYDENVRIDVSHLPVGMYYVRIGQIIQIIIILK